MHIFFAAAPLTIGGPCTYSEADKKDFKIMTRTKEQSLLMHLPPNGEFDWPDYRAFETCPVCCRRAKPGTNERYWLLFQPLLQHFENETQAGMAIRFITRLTCEDCFETITEDKYVHTKVQGETSFREVPLLDVVEEQGPITWLNDGQMSARSPSGAILNAYALYGSWEHSGAWQVLTNHFESNFNELASKSIPGGLERRPGKAMTKDSSTFWEMSQIPIKEGMECDGPDCSRVHGNRMAPEQGKKKGKKIRLQECMGCFEAYYCSEKCQHAGWADHKESCKEIQRKRKEEDEKKKEQQMMDDEAKMEAALASFVPVNITPQGGGAKKKKGKKGGGKKKSGKKK